MNKQIIIAGGLLLTMAACTKETEYEKYPFKEIAGFSVTNGSTQVAASVSEGKIFLYWPAYMPMPDSVAPVIAVSENATISPASGKNVALESGVVYTVTAEDGQTATYTLQLVVNQPDITIVDAADLNGTLKSTLALDNYVTGVIPDTAVTRVYLVPATGEAVRVKITELSNSAVERVLMRIEIPETGLNTGAYKLRIVSSAKTVTSTRSFIVLAPTPPPVPVPDALTASLSVQQGTTFTITGSGLDGIVEGRIRSSADFEYYPLEVVSVTATSATFRVPAGTAAGPYGRLELGYNSTDGVVFVRMTGPAPIFTVTE